MSSSEYQQLNHLFHYLHDTFAVSLFLRQVPTSVLRAGQRRRGVFEPSLRPRQHVEDQILTEQLNLRHRLDFCSPKPGLALSTWAAGLTAHH